MSGCPSCASTEPSTYSTSEWMTLCGWMTTSIARRGTPNSQCASITSRPLFIIVAESTEILRPIDQFGCAHASSGVTAPNCASGRSRNGPPEAVSRMRRTPRLRGIARVARGQALEDRVVLAVDRHAASRRPPAAARMNSAPPITSASLFASRMRLPARAAASVGESPAAPTIAASTVSTSPSEAAAARPSGPASTRVGKRSPARSTASARAASTSSSAAIVGRKRRHSAASFAALRCAASAATAKRSGWRAMTSSAESPIEPVAPSSATRRIMRVPPWRARPSPPVPRTASRR